MPNAGNEPDVELKAGHPPALKVGNMRVTQRTHSISSDKGDDARAAGGDSAAATTVPSACSFAPKQEVDKATGGVPENVANHGNTEAIKHIHDKPHASHDFRNNSSKPSVIQQPSKK